MTRRMMILSFIVLLLSVMMASAQDDTQGDIEIFSSAQAEAAYMFTVNSDGGFINEVMLDEDGTLDMPIYNLLLDVVPNDLDLIQLAPTSIIRYQTETFATLWDAVLVAQGDDATQYPVGELLIDGEGTLEFRVWRATYDQDAEVMELSIEVLDYIPNMAGLIFDIDKIQQVGEFPTEFGMATVNVFMSREIATQITSGGVVNAVGIRAGGNNEDCEAAQDYLDGLQIEYADTDDASTLRSIRLVEQYLRDNDCY